MGSPLGEHLFQFRIAFLLQAMLLPPNSSPPFGKCKCNVEESGCHDLFMAFFHNGACGNRWLLSCVNLSVK